MASNDRYQFGFKHRIFNGALGGIIGVSTVFPVDTIKTRLQNQISSTQYSGLFDCAKKIHANEGVRAFYKGWAVNVSFISFEKATKLVANDYFRFLLSENGQISLPRQAMAGAGAGLCQILITTPMELLKVNMQQNRIAVTASSSNNVVARPSVVRFVLGEVQQQGLRVFPSVLYKGFYATMLRDVPYSAIYFPLYAKLDSLGPSSNSQKHEPVLWWNFLSGVVAAAVSSVCVTPFDVVKTRLQTFKDPSGGKAYSGILDCVARTFKQEGISAFFKGAMLRVYVIAPLFGITQGVYQLGVGEALFAMSIYM